MNSWGTGLLSFVNSLYNLIINFLSDIGNLGKIVYDNVLYKSWSSYWQHESHFRFGEQWKELGGTPREGVNSQFWQLWKALEPSSQNQRKKTGQRGSKEELANKQDTNSLKSVFFLIQEDSLIRASWVPTHAPLFLLPCNTEHECEH